jgi:hypothetical protein
MKYLMIAQTTPQEGREEEFDEWYDTVHLGEVLSLPGFVAAQRFKVVSGQSAFSRYAAYEVEADSPAEVWKIAAGLNAFMTPTDAMAEQGGFIVEAMGPRRVQEDVDA